MVGAERLDFLGLPRGKLPRTDTAEVVSVVGDSTTAAHANQLFVGADADPLVAVVAHPPPSQLPLGQQVGKVAPVRLLGTEYAGRDTRGNFSDPVGGLPIASHQGAHLLVLLTGEEDVGASGVWVDHLDRLSGLLLDRLPLLFGELEHHRGTLGTLTDAHLTTPPSETPGDSRVFSRGEAARKLHGLGHRDGKGSKDEDLVNEDDGARTRNLRRDRSLKTTRSTRLKSLWLKEL
jgi:hypothetical protein